MLPPYIVNVGWALLPTDPPLSISGLLSSNGMDLDRISPDRVKDLFKSPPLLRGVRRGSLPIKFVKKFVKNYRKAGNIDKNIVITLMGVTGATVMPKSS